MGARTKTKTRAGILALVVLFVASQLGHWLHQSSERHVRCAEHGEWVHAPSASALAGDGSAAEGPELLKLARTEASHEHCELSSLERERALPCTAAFDVVRPVIARAEVRVAREAPRADAIPRYALAPKQSPPC